MFRQGGMQDLQNVFQDFPEERCVQVVTELVEMGHIPNKNVLANLAEIAHILCIFIKQRAIYRIDKGAVFTAIAELLCKFMESGPCGNAPGAEQSFSVLPSVPAYDPGDCRQ